MTVKVPALLTTTIQSQTPAVSNSSNPVTSAVSLANGVANNITSLVLAPGSYVVWGTVDLVLGAATVSLVKIATSIVSNTLPSQPGGGSLGADALTVSNLATSLLSQTVVIPTPMTFLDVSVTTTLYLVGQCAFSLGTVSAYGTLWAMQIGPP